jgi:hypothetical protein
VGLHVHFVVQQFGRRAGELSHGNASRKIWSI